MAWVNSSLGSPSSSLRRDPAGEVSFERLGDLERRRDRLVLVVEEELGEVAGLGPLERPDADDLHRASHRLGADPELEDARRLHRRRQGEDLLAPDFHHPRHHLVGVVKPVERIGFDHHVGEHAVQPVAHLVGKPGHDRVDHDHRGHPEHHADHAGQRDVSGAQIPPAEQVLVHDGHSFRGMGRRVTPGCVLSDRIPFLSISVNANCLRTAASRRDHPPHKPEARARGVPRESGITPLPLGSRFPSLALRARMGNPSLTHRARVENLCIFRVRFAVPVPPRSAAA